MHMKVTMRSSFRFLFFCCSLRRRENNCRDPVSKPVLNVHISDQAQEDLCYVCVPSPLASLAPVVDRRNIVPEQLLSCKHLYSKDSNWMNGVISYTIPHRSHIRDIYIHIRHLNCSSRTPVYRAITTNNEPIILKSFPSNDGQPYDHRVTNECYIHTHIKHINIVNAIDCFWCRESIYLVMEEMQCSLTSVLPRINKNESAIRYIMHSLISALAYIHSQGFIHRDVKSDNILVNRGYFKLADFGFATCLTVNTPWRKSSIGSPYWMAPEVIRGEFYDFAVDIWSAGTVLLELVNGEVPFFAQIPHKAIFLIEAQKEHQPINQPELWSRDLLDFCDHCLCIDATKRWSADHLMQHPFLQTEMTNESMMTVLGSI